MCGRYYVDDDTAKEIERVIRLVDAKVNGSKIPENGMYVDIHPSDIAPVLLKKGDNFCVENIRWGFPAQDKKLIINARSETALEKRMFSESVSHRRIAIPATGFYEWNRDKKKYTFYRKNSKILWMAGFFNRYQDEDRFVILTTGANASMSPVHDRMPLILNEEELEEWIEDGIKTEGILKKIPCELEKKTDYEQLSLF